MLDGRWPVFDGNHLIPGEIIPHHDIAGLGREVGADFPGALIHPVHPPLGRHHREVRDLAADLLDRPLRLHFDLPARLLHHLVASGVGLELRIARVYLGRLTSSLHDASVPEAEAYYLYNPFAENLFGPGRYLAQDVELSCERYSLDIMTVQGVFRRD